MLESPSLGQVGGAAEDAEDDGPTRALDQLLRKGLDRGMRDATTMVVSALMGGMYIAVGGSVYVRALESGASDALAAMLFPVGLAFVVSTGTDLLTSNMMLGLLPVITRDSRRSARWRVENLLRLWATSLVGNAVACALCAAFAVSCGVVEVEGRVAAIAVHKASLGPALVFAKAVGANWMVCLAVFQAAAAEGAAAKLAALWLPIAAFVFLGLEHSVANMFFLSAGAFAGAPLTAWQALVANLLPCLAGNVLGAGLFAAGQWHCTVAAASVSKRHKRP